MIPRDDGGGGMNFRDRYESAKRAPMVMRDEEPDPIFRYIAAGILFGIFFVCLAAWFWEQVGA